MKMKRSLADGIVLVLLVTSTLIVHFVLSLPPQGGAPYASGIASEVSVAERDSIDGSGVIDLDRNERIASVSSHEVVSSTLGEYGKGVTHPVGIQGATKSPSTTFSSASVIREDLSYVPGLIPAASGETDDSEAPTLTGSVILTSGSPITIYLPSVFRFSYGPLTESDWSMAGANAQRTSWVSEEVRGDLDPLWYKTIEPYISQRVQIITAYGNLYVSTARGLYTLDAETGAEGWVYPTELPLGHSPTVADGVVYVGGFDRKLHAINAFTGEGLWAFEAKAGFETNPLVVNGVVYAGNRDGTFYAVDAAGGQLLWQYQTEGPIRYSAAYESGVVFFASDDMHAYALDAQTGDLVWRSEKLAGAGFSSWWPVVYGDRVVFAGSHAYASSDPGIGSLGPPVEYEEFYPTRESDPKGTLIGPLGTASGDWVAGTPTIDASRILDYFAQKPWRKTVFVLDAATGEERETAPVLWAAARSGTRYPPVVGGDAVLYQQNSYMSGPSIPGGHISGWQPANKHISVVSSDWGAVDEPHAAAAGGNLIYWNLCCDRQAHAFDVTMPNTLFAERYNEGFRPPTGGGGGDRVWSYFGYNLVEEIPGYNALWYNPRETYTKPGANYGGVNGVYGNHADVNPPIPYDGRVYMHRSNAIIAFGSGGGDPVALPMAETVPAGDEDVTPLGADYLQAELETEIQKMLDAGHLRPGYANHGLFSHRARADGCGDDLVHYWHQPGETIYTLIEALPHLSPALRTEVRDYVRSEFTSYPPYQYNHIGWRDGASREAFEIPPEVASSMADHSPETQNYNFHWRLNPYAFYTLWKYAEEFGDPTAIFEASRERLNSAPTDDVLSRMPHVHNAFIAGYLGYLELEDLAGYRESTAIRSELNRLLRLRADTFTKDTAYTTEDSYYCRTMNVSNNFLFLVPELATYLRENAPGEVRAALDEYREVAPYWFVSFASEGYAENAVVPLYDGHAMFMAKALILDEPADELERFLDVPGFAVGDLFYIQKLLVLLEKDGS